MGMIGAPTEREYQALVRLNLLKDCPISNADIVNANKIFGPDLANIRGKKVRRKPEHVNTEIVAIPREILEIQKSVTLVADVMLVNKVPFLISSSRNINLTTIEHVPHPTASKLALLLHRIIRVYARAGFRVQTILMDNEFEKVKAHVDTAILNTTAAAEHVGEIERRIRVVKERSRGIICTLPYPILPRTMLIHLLHHIVMWLNNFPVANGVSDRFSPREIILRHKLDYRHHCRAPFGAYCEVYEDNTPTNSMKTRGLPAICLGPTRNIQGTYSFLSLVSGLAIKQRQFNELPAPDSVIKRVTTLAGADGIPSRLVFANRYKQPFDWPDNTATLTPDGLDPTPMAVYPDIPAEMPGVVLSRLYATMTQRLVRSRTRTILIGRTKPMQLPKMQTLTTWTISHLHQWCLTLMMKMTSCMFPLQPPPFHLLNKKNTLRKDLRHHYLRPHPRHCTDRHESPVFHPPPDHRARRGGPSSYQNISTTTIFLQQWPQNDTNHQNIPTGPRAAQTLTSPFAMRS